MNSQNLEHTYIPTNGIRLHVVQSGSRYGTPVILLHGFPEFWYGWRTNPTSGWSADARISLTSEVNLSDKPRDWDVPTG
jgi:pimeloyl-ACP methyl ester carboxylesterase